MSPSGEAFWFVPLKLSSLSLSPASSAELSFSTLVPPRLRFTLL